MKEMLQDYQQIQEKKNRLKQALSELRDDFEHKEQT